MNTSTVGYKRNISFYGPSDHAESGSFICEDVCIFGEGGVPNELSLYAFVMSFCH